MEIGMGRIMGGAATATDTGWLGVDSTAARNIALLIWAAFNEARAPLGDDGAEGAAEEFAEFAMDGPAVVAGVLDRLTLARRISS